VAAILRCIQGFPLSFRRSGGRGLGASGFDGGGGGVGTGFVAVISYEFLHCEGAAVAHYSFDWKVVAGVALLKGRKMAQAMEYNLALSSTLASLRTFLEVMCNFYGCQQQHYEHECRI
jgi:hypothetical protein